MSCCPGTFDPRDGHRRTNTVVSLALDEEGDRSRPSLHPFDDLVLEALSERVTTDMVNARD